MGLVSEILDHADRARARLLQQYRGMTKLESVLNIVSTHVQELETALWDIWEVRTLDAATGAQLDLIGRVVKMPREGATDTTYRLRIRARIRLMRSSGLVEDIIGVFVLLVPSGVALRVVQQFPAGFVLRLEELAIGGGDVAAYLSFLGEVKAAGVHALLEYMQGGTTPSNAFTFARATFLTRAHVAADTGFDVVDTTGITHGGDVFVSDGSISATYNGIRVTSSTRIDLASGTLGLAFANRGSVRDTSDPGLGWGNSSDAAVGGQLIGAQKST